jgi:hypothetical protein
MSLSINEKKSKYLIMSRKVVKKSNLKVGPYYFEHVENFKYPGANINEKNNMHNEIQIKIKCGKPSMFCHQQNAELQNVIEIHERKTNQLLTPNSNECMRNLVHNAKG